MRKRTRAFLLTAVGGLTTLGLCLALAKSGKSARLPITLTCWGQYSPTQALFSASVTNRSSRPIVLDAIFFEWKERSGHIDKTFAFSGWNFAMPPGGSTISVGCVPLDAEKVRAASVDDGGGLAQRIALRLHLAQYPKLRPWLARTGLVPPNGGLCYTHRSGWITNPLREAKRSPSKRVNGNPRVTALTPSNEASTTSSSAPKTKSSSNAASEPNRAQVACRVSGVLKAQSWKGFPIPARVSPTERAKL